MACSVTIILTYEDKSAALLAAIKEYEASKWKVIGQKVGKPAKVREHSNNHTIDHILYSHGHY